jgi:uncharacterized protein (TIGR03089 family)
VSPADLLGRALRRDPGRPFVTYYDLEVGGRVELSVATFDNWATKAANLLAEEHDVGPGDDVSVVLRAHWLGLVVVQAVWTLGATVTLQPGPGATLRVRADGDTEPGGHDLVVVSARPMGGPAGSVPAGATDLGREVLGYPDVLAVPSARSDDPLARMAPDDAASRHARTVVVGTVLDERVLREALVAPLVRDGSAVLVQPGATSPGSARLADIAASEHAVVVTG